MIRTAVGFLLVVCAYSIAIEDSVVAPTPATCVVPWPKNGRWVNCIPETKVNEGDLCQFEHQFGYKCTYPDGDITCDNRGNFEQDNKGPLECNLIPHPEDGKGCARYDFDSVACKLVEGCVWSVERSWCETACRKTGCGVELHRRSNDCQFNCPLHNASQCGPWQAGCGCIQDTDTVDCESWCQDTNQEKFHWLPKPSTPSDSYLYASDNVATATSKNSIQMTVSDALKMTNELGSDPISMCKDSCQQRGVCIAPKYEV